MGSLLFLQFFGKYRTVRKMYSRKPRRANHSWRDVGVKGPPLQGSAHATSPRRGPIRPESTLHPSCPPDQSSLSLLGFGPASLLRFARELSCCNHTPPEEGPGRWGREARAWLGSPPARPSPAGALVSSCHRFVFCSVAPWAQPSEHRMLDPLVQTLGCPAWGRREPLMAPECARGGAVRGQPASLMCPTARAGLSLLSTRARGAQPRTRRL